MNSIMKTKLTTAVAALALLCACTDEIADLKGERYSLKGSLDVPGFTWLSSSKVGLYSIEGSPRIANAECRIDGWGYEGTVKDWKPSRYEGQEVAVFNTPAVRPGNGSREYLIYAPYDKNTVYVPSERMIYDFNINHNQTQTKPGAAEAFPSLCTASADLSSGKPLEFCLKPLSAVVRIDISSKEYEGYSISRVSFSDDSGHFGISGTSDISLDDMSFNRAREFNYIHCDLVRPEPLAEGSVQSFFINLYPGDYSSAKFSITITLTKGKTTVALPIKRAGAVYEAGKIDVIEVLDLKTSDNSVGPWYCPFESRSLSGEGYAYGEANTYFIQSKSAVYNGGVLNPNPDIPEEVVIDYRLRGNYVAAEAPENVSFEWAKVNGSSIWLPRTDDKFVCDKYSFSVDEANYKVTVRNEGSTSAAPILLMKNKDGKILWGWAFWNIAPDGTTLDPINIAGYEMAPFEIGIPTSDIAGYVSKTGSAHISRTVYYYQWGRYLPTFWNSFLSVSWAASAEGQAEVSGSGNVLGLNGPFKNLKEALAHPAGVITHVGSDDMPDWIEESVPELWGATPANELAVGVKSVYDPCPKGWRVPDNAAMLAVAAAAAAESRYDATAGHLGMYVGDAFFGYYGYFIYSRLDTPSSRFTGGGIAGSTSAGYPGYFWTNYLPGETSATANALRYYFKVEGKTPAVAGFSKTTGIPVRCMKDDDER